MNLLADFVVRTKVFSIDKEFVDMDVKKEISTPIIVVCLRVVGCLCPLAGFVLAGTINMETGPGWGVILASLGVALLWFALASIVRLLDRIDKHLSRSPSEGESTLRGDILVG